MGDRCMLRSPSGQGGMKHGVLQSFELDQNECLLIVEPRRPDQVQDLQDTLGVPFHSQSMLGGL